MSMSMSYNFNETRSGVVLDNPKTTPTLDEIDNELKLISQALNDDSRDLGPIGDAQLERRLNNLLDKRLKLSN